jgi:hypothetical protein
MSSKKNKSETNGNSQNYSRRKNKKDNQLSKRFDRQKKESGTSNYIDTYDLPEGAYNNTIDKIDKLYIKSNITDDSLSSNSNSPHASDDGIKEKTLYNYEDPNQYDEEEEVFDDSYFEPQVYVDPKKK